MFELKEGLTAPLSSNLRVVHEDRFAVGAEAANGWKALHQIVKLAHEGRDALVVIWRHACGHGATRRLTPQGKWGKANFSKQGCDSRRDKEIGGGQQETVKD